MSESCRSSGNSQTVQVKHQPNYRGRTPLAPTTATLIGDWASRGAMPAPDGRRHPSLSSIVCWRRGPGCRDGGSSPPPILRTRTARPPAVQSHRDASEGATDGELKRFCRGVHFRMMRSPTSSLSVSPLAAAFRIHRLGPGDLRLLDTREHIGCEQQRVRDEEVDCDEGHGSSWKSLPLRLVCLARSRGSSPRRGPRG
jgi:hypothetical protein